MQRPQQGQGDGPPDSGPGECDHVHDGVVDQFARADAKWNFVAVEGRGARLAVLYGARIEKSEPLPTASSQAPLPEAWAEI